MADVRSTETARTMRSHSIVWWATVTLQSGNGAVVFFDQNQGRIGGTSSPLSLCGATRTTQNTKPQRPGRGICVRREGDACRPVGREK